MGLNSPLPVRLEEETRKAAKILRSFVDSNNNGLDKVIPRSILERAAGFAIFTVFKAGFVFSARAGSGVVIARLDDGSWSPPSAIGLGGFGFGGQMGAEVTDFLIVLNSRAAVTSFMSAGSLQLGGNLSVAVGPLGRNAEGSGSVNLKGRVAAMYSYSKTKGLFGGVSVEGSVIVERQDANRLAYGGNPSAKQILSGTFEPPPWCGVLIDQLEKSTGLPGGQKWKERDEDGEGGGMGSDRNGGGGYVFGAGVGAEGSGPGSGGSRRAGSLFGSAGGGPGSPGLGDSGGSPSRPGVARNRSSFNPFSNSGSSSPRKLALENSSETYTAGLTHDSSGPIGGASTNSSGRSRSGSLLRNGEVPPPFSYMSGKSTPDRSKDRDLLGDWDGQPAALGGTHAPRKTSGGERDLLGKWEADGQGLSASFARLSTGNNGNRSRSNSKPTPFDDILEDTSTRPSRYDSQTTSRDNMSSGAYGASGKPRPYSSYVSSTSSGYSPFEEDNATGQRSESGGRYGQIDQGHRNGYDDGAGDKRYSIGTTGKPDLRLRAGLDHNAGSYEGYARAVALFDFPASADGDLPLRAGQVVVVLGKVGDKGDWWKGRVAKDVDAGGPEGMFPANYVEVVELPKNPKGGLSWGELKKRVGGNEFD
ncbi:hypothetical protein IAU60_006065 [Kwoniella sp. DSM 27419]